MTKNDVEDSLSEEASLPEETKENREIDSEKEEDIQVEGITVAQLELERLREEVGEYKNKYVRLLAEGENSRKRLLKEREELTQYAVENVLADLLRPIDQLENALQFADQASDEIKNWAVGFQMILSQFKDVLQEQGIKPFDCVGEVFDPHKHDAMEVLETDEYPSDTIVKEVVRGYMMGERVIRPARVVVAKPVKESSPEEAESKEQ